ncbi:MAG: MoaD/ThiS family protein [Planctomycetales bacterium]|nr:MoaD/ThiS family protein [Planctomycetales bacterium]MBN8626470.1 MoaD/ThiS family protein [Planctomycetota bacterium]
MPRVLFTPHLQRHLACPPQDVDAGTVREALEKVFAASEPLRGYVVDERFRLRRHVVIFVNNRPITDREGLTDAVGPTSEIYVLQALSGG